MNMEPIDLCWLCDDLTLEQALKLTFESSGQRLKRHFSSKELNKIVKKRDLSKLPIDYVNYLKINPIYNGPEVKIIHEDKNYIAFHKPGDVHCHPLCYSDQNTLLNFLAMSNILDPLNINLGNYDRGLLYRLDFETSGVIVLAKNFEYYLNIRHNFNQVMKRKLYWAIVEGNFDKDGDWTHNFKASGPKGSKQKIFDEPQPGAVPGSLRIHKLCYQDGKSLVLVDLASGLRHQIRAQLSHLGFPILGDTLYGAKQSNRLYLHAWRYEWLEVIQDNQADLFDSFFDLNSALKMSHNMLRIF